MTWGCKSSSNNRLKCLLLHFCCICNTLELRSSAFTYIDLPPMCCSLDWTASWARLCSRQLCTRSMDSFMSCLEVRPESGNLSSRHLIPLFEFTIRSLDKVVYRLPGRVAIEKTCFELGVILASLPLQSSQKQLCIVAYEPVLVDWGDSTREYRVPSDFVTLPELIQIEALISPRFSLNPANIDVVYGIFLQLFGVKAVFVRSNIK